MIRPRSAGLAVLVLPLVLSTACRRARTTPAGAPVPVATDSDADRAARERAERERLERERLERERAERERAEAERLAALRRTMEVPVYFGFDRFDLTTEAREALEAKVPLLTANAAMTIVVEGHADEAGSDEYNLALGQRRAAAAKRFLTQRGIDAARIEIVSFGEERPACAESTDACHARNRRDEFRITAGGPVADRP